MLFFVFLENSEPRWNAEPYSCATSRSNSLLVFSAVTLTQAESIYISLSIPSIELIPVSHRSLALEPCWVKPVLQM